MTETRILCSGRSGGCHQGQGPARRGGAPFSGPAAARALGAAPPLGAQRCRRTGVRPCAASIFKSSPSSLCRSMCFPGRWVTPVFLAQAPSATMRERCETDPSIAAYSISSQRMYWSGIGQISSVQLEMVCHSACNAGPAWTTAATPPGARSRRLQGKGALPRTPAQKRRKPAGTPKTNRRLSRRRAATGRAPPCLCTCNRRRTSGEPPSKPGTSIC